MNVMFSTLRIGASVLVGGLLIAGPGVLTGHAAAVTFAGADIGTPTHDVGQWRSASQAKPLDADGNNVYGSAGYALFAATNPATSNGNNAAPNTFPTNGDPYTEATNLISLPSWVATSAILTGTEAGGWNYKSVDNPVTTPGGSPSLVKLGLLTDGTGNKWSFTVGAAPPSDFRFGVMMDGLDSPGFPASAITLTSSISGTATTLTPADGLVDFYFFDVKGAVTGETFTLSGLQGVNGTAGIDGVSFDVFPVPEPSSLVACLSIGALVVFRVRRRKRAG
jgi:hypothetical protein